MSSRTKACTWHQRVATLRNLSSRRSTQTRRPCKPQQASTGILVSRWSVVTNDLCTKAGTPICLLRRRRQFASTSLSTSFARLAPKVGSNTSASSMRSGSRQRPSVPSQRPGALDGASAIREHSSRPRDLRLLKERDQGRPIVRLQGSQDQRGFSSTVAMTALTPRSSTRYVHTPSDGKAVT